MDVWTNDKRTSLTIFNLAAESKLGLFLRGAQRLDDLKIQEIRPDETPDIHEYLDALAQIEPSKRVGAVVLPELKSAQPGKPVTISFAPGSTDAKAKE